MTQKEDVSYGQCAFAIFYPGLLIRILNNTVIVLSEHKAKTAKESRF